MLGKLLLISTLALTQGRNVEPESTLIPFDLCPAQGHHLLPHEYDCTKFYYCEYGMKWETARDCSPGTEFSYQLQVCIHPSQAGCDLPGTPPPSTEETEAPTEAPTEPPTESTTTTTEAPTEPPTEAPTTTTEAPTKPPTTTTEAPTEPPTEAPTTITEAPTEPPTEAPTTTTEAPTEPPTEAPTTTTEAPTEPPTEAPTTTSEAPTEPPTKPPTTTTEAPTEAPTDPPTEATAAPTEPSTKPPTTTTEAPTTTTTQAPSEPPTTTVASTEPATETTEAPTDATEKPDIELLPNGCPADFEVHLLLPHETKCNKFYYCVFGEKVVRECALGTHFNPALQVCDWPENVNCVNVISSEEEDSGDLDAEGSGDPEIDVDSSEMLPNGCPADFDQHKLLQHESDCSKFYYCVLGETVERQCAEGTLFNAELQVCDWPQNVNCSNTDNTSTEDNESYEIGDNSSTEDNGDSVESEVLENGCPADFDVHQLLPHESSCTKFYYCVHGNKVERECGANTHFNPVLQACDWPENAGCAISGGNSSEESRNSEENRNSEETDTGTTEIDTEGSGGNEDDVTEVELLPNGCPADFDVHQLLPHESECTKFYYCVFGEKVVRECGPGTHFNPTLQVCDWPQNAGCAYADSNETSTENDNGSGDNETTSTEDNHSEENGSGVLENGCPADFDVHQLLPHESSCTKFYYCVFGEKVVRECGPGTHFNPTLQVCDWPQNAGCANAGSEEATSTESGNGGGDSTGDGSSENNGSGENGGVLENGCPADFDVHQLLPHESECTKFYYCVFGEKVERECGPGTHFNPTLQVCDWPQNAGCAIGSGETDTSTEDGSGNSGETEDGNNTTEVDGGNSGATEDGNNTTEVDGGNSGETDEGNNTTEVDGGNTGETDEGNNTTEVDAGSSNENGNETEIELLPNGCPADFDIHHLLPHETDCGKFYYCVFGEKVERNCSDGLFFNPALQVCDWPRNVNCTNANSGESGNSGENENSTETGNESTENGGNENGVLENGCPADFDVHQLLPHESSCTKFYYCVFGEKVVRECGPGTHFNPTLQVCDWPQNAGCANAGSEENTTTEGSGSTEAGSSEDNNGSGENGSGVLENGCPADFDVHQLLPHESECTKFYYCVFGEKVVRECGPGTHFNPTLQVCDWPQNAGCATSSGETDASTEGGNGNSGETEDGNNTTEVDGGNSGETDEGNNTTEVDGGNTGETEDGNNTTEVDGGSSNENGNETEIVLLPNGCPADFDIHYLLPHETKCGNFYYCVRGEKVERECSDGLFFNPAIQVCDWPANVNCTNANSSENGNSGENESSTETGNESTENGGGEDGMLENGCPADFDVHKLLPHQYYCDKFYYCVFGEKVERECSPGLHFNPKLQVCDFPINVGCIGSAGVGIDSSEETTSSEVTEPILPNGCPSDFDVHQLLPHETECTKFYYCVFGEKVERECGPGTHFNPVLQVCDWPQNAGCINSGSNENSTEIETSAETETSTETGNGTEPETSTETGNSTETETSTETGNSTETETSTETGNSENEKCKSSCNIPAWAHEHDCDKFWRCDGEIAVLGTCAEGLHFNVNTQTCDFICNAGCVRDDVQSTPEQDGLKLFLPWDKVDSTIRKLYLTGQQ